MKTTIVAQIWSECFTLRIISPKWGGPDPLKLYMSTTPSIDMCHAQHVVINSQDQGQEFDSMV